MIRLRLIIIGLILWCSQSIAQINEMHYWFDDDFASRQIQVIPASPENASVMTNLDVSSLDIGLHTLHYRFRDDSGIYSVTNSHMFWKTQVPAPPASKNLVQYEFWYDDDFSSLQIQVLSGSPEDVSITTSLDVSALDMGIHSLHYRFLDDDGMYSVTNSHLFWKTTAPEAPLAREIVKYEYWYDSDFVGRQTEPMTQTQDVLVSSDFDVSALNDGLHILNLRFFDNEGLWSSVTSHIFHKTTPVVPAPATAVTEYQFWYNDDFSAAQTVAAGTFDFALISDMDISSLTEGLNIFHIRFKDNLGNWSSVKSNVFFITNEPETPVMVNLTSLEYWYDDDFENRESVAMSNHDENWMETLDLSALQSGLHTMSFRVCDENMLWSSVKTNFFYLIEVETPLSSNPIKRIRYWLNDDFDNHQIMEISTSENDILFTENIPLYNVSAGEYIFRYQFQDSIGTWSVPMFDTIQKDAYPWISVSITETDFCGSGEFLMTYDTADVSSIDWDFGDGMGETGFEPTHVYVETGTYSPEVTVHHSGTSQTMAYEIPDDIYVHPEYEFDSTLMICAGDSVLFQGSYYYETGVYEVNHFTFHGCDSTYAMSLGENPVHEIYLTENICEGDSLLFDGIYLQESGNYQVNLSNQFLCDSVVYLDLLMNPVDTVFLNDEICDGDSLMFEGLYLSGDGEYVSTLTNQYDCDSVRVMNLTVNPTPETPVIAQDADTLYTADQEILYWYFNGELLDDENSSSLVCAASGDYFVIAGNAFSCLSDSSEIINVILTGLKTGESFELSVFPNPVKEHLYIELSSMPQNSVKYSLVNLTGQILRQGSIMENRSYLEVSDLVPGTYLLLIDFENRTQSVKILKQ